MNTKLNIKFVGLKILAILVLAILVAPNMSHAATYGKQCNNVGCNYIYETAPAKPQPTTVYNPTLTYGTPTVYSTTAVAKKTTTSAPKKTGTVLGTSTSTKTFEDDVKDLAGNVAYGSDGFLPSGIIGWILFAILVLIIIILIRKVFGGEKDYHETPLKHA